MERPAPKTGGVRNDPPAPAPAPETEPEAEPAAPSRPRPIPTGARVVLFLWVTAFGFLVAYELIYVLFKFLNLRE